MRQYAHDFDRRVQLLLDRERYERLEVEAARRGVSVAAVIREAIDRRLPVGGDGEVDQRDQGWATMRSSRIMATLGSKRAGVIAAR